MIRMNCVNTVNTSLTRGVSLLVLALLFISMLLTPLTNNRMTIVQAANQVPVLLHNGFLGWSVEFQGMLFFMTTNGLWKSDGTPQGTVLVKGGLSDDFSSTIWKKR